MTRVVRSRIAAAIVILCSCIARSSLAPVGAAESVGAAVPLTRAAWWPLDKGPHYGDLEGRWDKNPRALKLDVGSFDTRGPGLDLPDALRFSTERAARPGTPWIVQLAGPVTEAMKDSLRERAVRFYAYYPQYAFVVRAPNPEALASMPGVVWAGPYHPAYRIEAGLGQTPTLDPVKARNETIYVRARLFEPAERADLITALEAAGALVDREATLDPGGWKDAVYFEGTPRQILATALRDEVRWIEEISREGFALNAESHVVVQSGLLSRGTPLWDAGVNGSTQVVGVMDNGMDVDTILLSNTASDAGTPGPAHRKVLAYTPFGGDMLSCGGSGYGHYTHGTNTSQCAVGNRSDFGQDGILDGVAKNAKIVFQDLAVTSSINCTSGYLETPSSFVAMYDQVRSFGGHLTNGSFSMCNNDEYASYAYEADEYNWNHKDFLQFFSAGNTIGLGLVCPATAKNVVAAGGFYQDPFFDHYGRCGPAPSGRMAPTVLGPACDRARGNPKPYNYDTSAHLQSFDDDITGTPEASLFQGACGTSYSSPYLMGAAALIRDYFEKGFYPTGANTPANAFPPSAALVKAVLLTSGEFQANCGSFMESTATCGQGMGRINLSRGLPIAGDSRTPSAMLVVDKGAAVGLATYGVYETTIDMSDSTKPLRVTVHWTDRPGSALVNNLRLTVTGPAGGAAQTYHGGNFQGEYSKSEADGGTNDDGVNVFESVFISPASLVVGTWTIRIDGTNVPNGDPNYENTQPFALVAVGSFAPTVREVSPSGSSSPLVVTGVSGETTNWRWESVPGPGVVYDFYRGTLASLVTGSYDHQRIDSAHCGLAANATGVADRHDGSDRYYLVGMRYGGEAGSLGAASDGTPRPPASPACP